MCVFRLKFMPSAIEIRVVEHACLYWRMQILATISLSLWNDTACLFDWHSSFKLYVISGICRRDKQGTGPEIPLFIYEYRLLIIPVSTCIKNMPFWIDFWREQKLLVWWGVYHALIYYTMFYGCMRWTKSRGLVANNFYRFVGYDLKGFPIEGINAKCASKIV